ncbi:MAG: AAA family ATPase [Alphaproteobacteria bacterium]|nr:AAA family ATPase [Alphaproteobacteria bacterium]MCB9930581.1 AAA family ATPase [Alphaproteobacteria bacterium]
MSEAFVVQDQSAVAAVMSDPATHGGVKPRRIDTHGAMVFIAGDRVYKIKRAVRFPFMDFSTLEKRHAALTEELRVNRRTAPGLYLGVLPLVETAAGIRLGRIGATPAGAIDYALVMRRFEATLDERADAGALSRADIVSVAETVEAFHRDAEPFFRADPAGRVGDAIAGVVREMRRNLDVLDAARVETFAALMASRHAAARRTILARAKAGLERHCHGDLHLRNICLFDGRPTLFDAIEFNPDFARIDVLYDLAFLLMDLEARGERPLANLALNTYLDRRVAAGWPDESGLVQLPLFLALRAGIKAEIGAHMANVQDGDEGAAQMRHAAVSHLGQALGYLHPVGPRLVAVGGLSGSGKSTLAGALAPDFGPAPGARWLRSDVLRKAWAGLGPLERLPTEAYTPEASAETYRRLIAAAEAALAAGHSVVLDAVFARPGERFAARALAARLGVPFTGLWLDAPEATRVERVETRAADASDAGGPVAKAQSAYDLGAITWHRIPAHDGPAAVLEQARRIC